MLYKSFNFFVFSLLLLLFSCKKEDGPWGEINTLKNGSNWSGAIEAYPNRFSDSKMDISVDFVDKDGVWENLLFFKIPLKIGRHKLAYTINQPPDDSLSGGKYFKGFEDELYDVYELAKNDSTSYIEITEYNEDKGEIKGKFSLLLWPDLVNSQNAPDSIVFSDGVFHTRIND